MEPLLVNDGSRHRRALTDLVLELAQRSAGFRHSLSESLLTSLSNLQLEAKAHIVVQQWIDEAG